MVALDPRRIRTAVIPAAGLGTRLRPLTLVTPKELLPLGRKPTVQYIVEELHSVEVNCIIFIVSPCKTGIREYFGDTACNGEVSLKYVVQQKQSGLADAILQAEDAVNGKDFIVALGDTVIISNEETSPLGRLIDAYNANSASTAISVERVPTRDAHRYGMVRPIGDIAGPAFEIDWLVEKPQDGCIPSDFAIGGRYIFGSHIFDLIRRTESGAGGEQQITDSIRLGISEGARVWCAPVMPGEYRYDIGNINTYCEAFTRICLMDRELAASVVNASEKT